MLLVHLLFLGHGCFSHQKMANYAARKQNKIVSSRNDESQRDNFNSLTNSIPLQKKNTDNSKYRTQKRNAEKFGEVWSHRT